MLLIEERKEEIKKIGFDWEFLPDGIALTSFPSFVPITDLINVFKDIIQDLKIENSPNLMEIVARVSCKYAIKSGMSVNPEEIIEIYENLKKKGINTCPHGRPIYYLVTYNELDRFFERK